MRKVPGSKRYADTASKAQMPIRHAKCNMPIGQNGEYYELYYKKGEVNLGLLEL